MLVNVFELTPDVGDAPRDDCYGCIGCPHLKSITITNSHEVYIDCDKDGDD